MTDSFYRALSSECYKLSKNRELWGILLVPVLLIFVVDFYIAYEMGKSGFTASGANPWQVLLGRYVFQFFYILYPILIAIFVHACCAIEYRNNNYRLLFTTPLSKVELFCSKALFIITICLLSVLASCLVFLFSGYFFSEVLPEIGFQNFEYRNVIMYTFFKLFITLVAISAIQLALSLTFKNFVYPIGFSVFMTIFSIIVASKKFSDFIPYKGSFNSIENIMSGNSSFERLDYSNMVMFFLFLLVGFYLFKKKKIE